VGLDYNFNCTAQTFERSAPPIFGFGWLGEVSILLDYQLVKIFGLISGQTMTSQQLDALVNDLVVLIADGNTFMRRLTRQMLSGIGVRAVLESADGVATVNAIPALKPDVVIIDWNLPGLNGPDTMRIVRSPGVFPKASLPAIMLTDLGLQSRVTEAIRVGVHELLVKPISPKMLQQRIFGILLNPRPMVRAGKFYIPMPRRRVELDQFIHAEP
jgi:two-component system chemotaxis response regulator CheY